MTSRLPSQIAWGSDFHNFPPLNDENLTMFEVLRDAGLHTAGFASHFYFSAGRGATQGFLEFDNEGAKTIADSNTDIASPRIVPRAVARMKQLAAEKKRFAMMVHLFEPHSRYVEHEEFPIQSKGVEGLEEKYDYEIAFVDRWVGELVDGLAAAGVAGDTMVGPALGSRRGLRRAQVRRRADVLPRPDPLRRAPAPCRSSSTPPACRRAPSTRASC
jgi:arylsulfatase A-like enzyme